MKFWLLLALGVSIAIPGAELLGPDKLWRPRSNLIFYLDDAVGGGFRLQIAKRDMNVYMEGPRPGYAFVIAPDGRVVARELLPDDGVVRNDFQTKDGIGDEFMDFRYREFHRANSPGGTPPGKTRSPFLDHPEKLPARTCTLNVPDGGKGIYRLVIAGSWDHFYSVTPSRRLGAGIHAGQGGMYLHKDQLAESYLYLPRGTKDLAIAVTEEVAPFNRRVKTPFFELGPSANFYRYAVQKNAPGDRVIKVETIGHGAGAMLHIQGAPMLLCDSEATARRFGGGAPEPELAVIRRYAPQFPEHKAFFEKLLKFNQSLGFRVSGDSPRTINAAQNAWLFRSSWWDFGDGWFNRNVPQNPPPELKRAIDSLFEKWALNRYVMELGLCTNQWGKIAEQLLAMHRWADNPAILEVLKFNVERLCKPGSLGRTNPDFDRSGSGREPDTGLIPGGILAEALGHDAEYNLESDSHLSHVYHAVPLACIPAYQNDYYTLKTHLTVSRTDGVPPNVFAGSCSPTDANSRTRYYTHKGGGLVNQIAYGDLWGGKNAKRKNVWPFLEKTPFVRIYGNRFAFVRTAGAYAVFHLGPPFPRWQAWSYPVFDGNSMRYAGFNAMGYGGRQAFPLKSGGFSALWLDRIGPVMMAANHDFNYANNLWGHTGKSAPHGKNLEPDIVSDALSDATVRFDRDNRRFTRSGAIPDTSLTFTRTVTVTDRGARVELEFGSSAPLRLRDLSESIPLFPDGRTFAVDGKPVDKLTKDGVYTGRTLTMTAANGQTATLEFDRPRGFTFSAPLRYRREAATMSAVNVRLNPVFAPGETRRIGYEFRRSTP